MKPFLFLRMQSKKLIIAVDGYSSCGKSTVAKQIAEYYDIIYVDSGAMYRAVALYFLRNNVDMADEVHLHSALDNISINFEFIDKAQVIHLNGEAVEAYIREPEINAIVSEVARISAVRSKLVALQREIAEGKSLVMDGRDIGTVVFPKAGIKFFLTADIQIRTERRFEENKEKGIAADYDAIQENLQKRDLIDSTRKDSPLKQADDAILINNSYLSKEEQLEQLKTVIDRHLAVHN